MGGEAAFGKRTKDGVYSLSVCPCPGSAARRSRSSAESSRGSSPVTPGPGNPADGVLGCPLPAQRSSGPGDTGQGWRPVPGLPVPAKGWFGCRAGESGAVGNSQVYPWGPCPTAEPACGHMPTGENIHLLPFPQPCAFTALCLNQTSFVRRRCVPRQLRIGDNCDLGLCLHPAGVGCFWRHLGAFCPASAPRRGPLSQALGTANRKGSIFYMAVPPRLSDCI